MKIVQMVKTMENYRPVLDVTFRLYDPLECLADLEHYIGTEKAKEEYLIILKAEMDSQYQTLLDYVLKNQNI